MADTRKYVQAQKFTLASGITTTDTSITLTSFNFPDGTAIASGDLGTINYGTLEPGTGREEQISFTGITTNGDGTVTLTGVVRGLGFGAVDTYSEQTNLKIQHGAGSVFILSNTAAFYDGFVNKGNDETMVGYLSVPTPVSGSHAVTKDYADGLTTATALSYDKIIIAGTAGESLAEGDLVYFDGTDNEWKRSQADTAATINNVLLGIAQGAGTNANPIAGGVLIYGLDPKNTGLTAGVKIYAGDTAGTVVEAPGTITRAIGWSDTTGTLIFDPDADMRLTQNEKDALAGGGDFGTPSEENKFLTEDITEGTGDVVRKSLLGVVTAGTTTRAANGGAGAVTVAHGLGAAPKYVKLNAVFSRNNAIGSSHQLSQSFGFANATNNYSAASRIGSNDFGSTSDFYVDTLNSDTYAIYIDTGAAGDTSFSHYQRAVVTFDETNITFTWTNATAEVATTIKILWEAYLS